MERVSSGERPKGAPRGRPFIPGTSGNPGGRPKSEDSLAAQLREVLAEVDERSGKTKARLVAEKMVAMGLADNVMALVATFDRVDGKPAQAITLRGDDAAPLHVLHTDRMEGWEAPGSLHDGRDERALPEPASD